MNNEENRAEDQKAPFDITLYPKEVYTNSRGETLERYIVPDDTFEEHLRELPNGTVNQSKSYRASCGGKLYIIGNDPERDSEIGKKGAEALHASLVRRRTFKEEADILLAKIDKNTGKSGIENITVAMYERALAGDVKAYTALRDTAGEKPADSLDLNANVITEADQALIEKLKNRVGVE